MGPNKLIDMEPQQQEAALPRVLAVQLSSHLAAQ